MMRGSLELVMNTLAKKFHTKATLLNKENVNVVRYDSITETMFNTAEEELQPTAWKVTSGIVSYIVELQILVEPEQFGIYQSPVPTTYTPFAQLVADTVNPIIEKYGQPKLRFELANEAPPANAQVIPEEFLRLLAVKRTFTPDELSEKITERFTTEERARLRENTFHVGDIVRANNKQHFKVVSVSANVGQFTPKWIKKRILNIALVYATSGPMRVTVKLQVNEQLELVGFGVWFHGVVIEKIPTNVIFTPNVGRNLIDLIQNVSLINYVNCELVNLLTLRELIVGLMNVKLSAILDCKILGHCARRSWYRILDITVATCTQMYNTLERSIRGRMVWKVLMGTTIVTYQDNSVEIPP